MDANHKFFIIHIKLILFITLSNFGLDLDLHIQDDITAIVVEELWPEQLGTRTNTCTHIQTDTKTELIEIIPVHVDVKNLHKFLKDNENGGVHPEPWTASHDPSEPWTT